MRNKHTPRRGGDTGRNASSRSTPKKDSKPDKSKGLANHGAFPEAESVLVEEIGSFFARGPRVSVKRGRKSNVQATLDAHERLPRFQRVTCRFVRLVASSVLLIPLLQQGQKRRNKFFFLRCFYLIGHRPCFDYFRLDIPSTTSNQRIVQH